MANYTVTTNFGAKDSLPSGNAGKLIKGTEFTTEFNNIATASATKADKTGTAFTGNISTSGTLNVAGTSQFAANISVVDDILLMGFSPTFQCHNSNTIPAANAVLGTVSFGTLGESNEFPKTATIAGIATSQWSTGVAPTDIVLSTTAAASGSVLTEHMRLSSEGDTIFTSDSNPTITLKNADTSIAADQVIGTVEFRGADDSGNVLAGHIQQVASGTWGIGDYGSDMVFSVKRGGTGGAFAEKLRLDYDGVEITGAATITTAAATSATASTFKNGTLTAGKINTHFINTNGYLSIGNKAAGLRFIDYQASRYITPFNVDTNVNSDNLIDLGNASARFDDIYATNATIQTSDQNEKQDIAELSEAETRVAVACKGLLRKFRWNSAVEAKGNEARTHFGIIAQDLQAAFEAEGLDAGNYAMFISTTWTNEDGEEQTRLGVRYSELLAFIIGGI